MTKRLISLMLVVIMLLSLCMTACSTKEKTDAEGEGEEETQEESQRPNMFMTLYAIKGDKMTDEALAAVEEKVSNYCVAKYKTAIDLRFFTEDEYQKGLDDMYDKFAAEAAEQLKKDQEAKASEKAEAEYMAKLSPEERVKYQQKKRLEAKAKAEEEKKKAEAQAELIEQGKDKAKVKEVPMDIIYIPGMTEYYDLVDQGLLVDMSTFLGTTYKTVKDYVYPAYLTAATVDSAIYGVPNNGPISTNETYFVVNKDLAEKYGVDFTAIKSITDLNGAFAKAKAEGYTPIVGDFGPEGVAFYNGIDMGHTTGLFTNNVAFGEKSFEAGTTNAILNPESTASDTFMKYCQTKAEYRKNGWIAENGSNFFISIQSLTEEEKTQWEEKGYDLVLYRGAEFNTEAALNAGLYGISSHCAEPERAMEIVELLSIDTQLRNLLAFGIEEEHYIVNADNKNIITVIDESYDMDFFTTGNNLIGYIPDTMDPDYATKGKEKNLNSFIDPFLGFRYNWEDENNAKWVTAIGQWKAYLDPIYDQVSYGNDNYASILATAYDNVRNNTTGQFSASYNQWQNDCTFRNEYKTYSEKIVKLYQDLGTRDITETEGYVAETSADASATSGSGTTTAAGSTTATTTTAKK